jgi:hypothetical protein
MMAESGNDTGRVSIDEVGLWTEIKLEIIQKYAAAYSTILSNQRYIKHSYIDAFAGLGYHTSKATKERIDGSPRVALCVEPPFEKYFFIDIEISELLIPSAPNNMIRARSTSRCGAPPHRTISSSLFRSPRRSLSGGAILGIFPV